MYLLFSPFKLLEEGLISLLILIDAKIYGLFAKLYSLYLELAMARLFDIDSFKNVISNVYVIFGVVALFIVVFSLLQAMVNPESVAKGTQTTKEIIKRLIMCVGLTCLVPFGFDFLYDVQYSILSYQVIPKALIGIGSDDNIEISESYTDADGNKQTIEAEMTASDFAKAGLQVYGNQMAFYVLNGFLYPLELDDNGNPKDVIVDADDFFGTESGIWFGVAGCAVLVIATGIAALSGVGLPAAATTALGATTICAGGAVAGVVVNDVLFQIHANEYSWNFVSQYMVQYYGEFDWITPFCEAVLDGRMAYTPIVSTIAGVIMIYMLFSFCLDLGIRAAKLAFYQIIAPISFLLSILPKNKDLMSNWFKLVLSTWAEVFVRIICVCGVALLISNLDFIELDGFGYIARAIICLGLVAFAKQLPKLFSEVTGIKSGNLKLGIKDKLKEGGFFTATNAISGVVGGVGGAIGGAIAGRSLISGLTGAGSGFKHGWKKGDLKGIGAATLRGYEYRQAKKEGMKFRDVALNTARGMIGLDSTAEEAERKIRNKAKNTRNPSVYGIKLKNGQTLAAGASAEITAEDIAFFDAEIEEKKGIIANSQEQIKQIDKSHQYAETQKGLKKFYEKDADGKWAEGKFSIDVAYKDSEGAIHVEKITGNRFEELKRMGVSFMNTKDMHYAVQYIASVDENGKEKIETANLTLAEIRERRRNGIKFKSHSLIKQEIEDHRDTLDVIRTSDIEDLARKEWITSELAAQNANGPSTITYNFIRALQTEGGFGYEDYKIGSDGNAVLDKNGNPILEKRGQMKVEIEPDEKTGNNIQVVYDEIELADGTKKTVKYKNIGYGQMERIELDENGKEVSSEFIVANVFADEMDKLAKSQQASLNAKKATLESETRADREAIAGMESVKTAYSDAIKGDLSSEKQRGKKAAKTYRGNRGK